MIAKILAKIKYALSVVFIVIAVTGGFIIKFAAVSTFIAYVFKLATRTNMFWGYVYVAVICGAISLADYCEKKMAHARHQTEKAAVVAR